MPLVDPAVAAHHLSGKRIAIWGFGREGRAALRFLRARIPDVALTVLDDAADQVGAGDVPIVSGRAAIATAIEAFDVVVKSPGISLYRSVGAPGAGGRSALHVPAQSLVCR